MEASYHVLLLTLLLFIIKPISASKTPTAYTAFIKTSCNSTTYPSLCYTSLSPYAASVRTNPKKLCNAALTVTIKSAKNTLNTVSKLAAQNGLTKSDAAAIKDCVEEVGDSIDEMKQSLKAMGGLGSAADKEFVMSTVKTWMSAAITDENTCTDGFGGGKVSVGVKNKVRSSILGVAKLTSNALSLINHLNY